MGLMRYVADLVDDDGYGFYASLDTIAGELRLTKKQARRVLHKLSIDCWLTVDILSNTKGEKIKATRYKLNMKKLREAPYPNAYCRKLGLKNGVPDAPIAGTPPIEGTGDILGQVPLPSMSLDPSHRGDPSSKAVVTAVKATTTTVCAEPSGEAGTLSSLNKFGWSDLKAIG